MANYHYRGSGQSLFAAQAGGSLQGRMLYWTATEFGLLNPDGSKTYYSGSGLVWDQAQGRFTSGTITAIHHYSMSGNYVDALTGLAMPIATLEPLLTAAASKSAISLLHATLMAGNDTLVGEAGNDKLAGGAGNDTISGGAGNDKLIGGKGADTLQGGTGRDLASYAASSAGVQVDLTTGKGYGGDAEGDSLTSIENLLGSKFNDTLTGNALANRLTGGNGNDTLRGEGGNDVLKGGKGADILEGGDGDDIISGGAGNDFITGGRGADVLFGGAGDDTIYGGPGMDLIKGGSGNNTIYGGPDPDVIIYDYAWSELIVGYDGSNNSVCIETPDGGKDTIFTANTFATTTGTYRFDLPTLTFFYQSAMTGDDWLA